jgi:predicted nucleotidyltransferase
VSSSKSFLVLIGSFARGDANRRSDIDFVEIGRPKATDALAGLPHDRKVNVIRYSIPRFRHLYENGDLFIHHVMSEGRLKAGDLDAWQRLQRNFRVRRNFGQEVRKNQKAITFLLSDRSNLAAPVAFLANFFRALKQIAIFRLAEQGQYIFVKKEAISRYFPWLPKRILQGMLTAEYVVNRKGEDGTGGSKFREISFCAHKLFALAMIHRKDLE